jgi:hypothetical protein
VLPTHPPTKKTKLMSERIEAFEEDHLDESAHLLVSTYNAEPWNDQWTLDTAKKDLTWVMEVPESWG